MSPTQFAHACLGSPPFPPPRPAPAASSCWLCGGPLGERAWARGDALPSTFAQHDDARVKTSPAVCEACAYFAVGSTWQAWLADPRAPKVKTWQQASWRSYGHFFRPDPAQPHECPLNSRWRDLLLDPPEPPFLAIVSLSGQKNLIFRAQVAFDRDLYPAQVEETTVAVDRRKLAACVDLVETALAAGLGREEIESGEARPDRALAMGLRRWRALDAEIAPWRRLEPMLLMLACKVAARPEQPAPAPEPPAKATPRPVPAAAPPLLITPSTSQMELF